MKRQLLILLLMGFALASAAYAQRIAVSVTTVGGLPATCTPNGHLYIVTDGNAADGSDCSTGGSSNQSLCMCNATGNGYVSEKNFIPAADPDTDHTFTDEITFDEIFQGTTVGGDPALAVDECFFAATATGGGFICEGSTDDTNEMYFLVPDLNEADTTHVLVTESATQTLTNKSISGDQIDSGTVPADRAGADHIDALTEIAQAIKTVANDTDPLAVYTGGNPGSNVCVEMNSSGQLISAGDTCANLGPAGGTLTKEWSMWEVMPDGTQCQTVSEQTINSGPHVGAIECADNAASALYFNVNSRSYAGGTLTFTFSGVNSNATPTGIFDMDISCQCRGDSDAMDSTFGTVQNFSITFDTQNDLELASNGTAVTPNGTCAADDYLFCRAIMDDTATTTEVADTVLLGIAVAEN
ncbi:MAG: hypothetical protein ACYSW0_22725 [Planctomycetota bacterium]